MPQAITTVVNARRVELLAERTEEALAANEADAVRLARELVDTTIILYGPCHLEVGLAQFYLAMALEEQGKIAQALSVRRRARRILLGHRICLN